MISTRLTQPINIINPPPAYNQYTASSNHLPITYIPITMYNYINTIEYLIYLHNWFIKSTAKLRHNDKKATLITHKGSFKGEAKVNFTYILNPIDFHHRILPVIFFAFSVSQ